MTDKTFALSRRALLKTTAVSAAAASAMSAVPAFAKPADVAQDTSKIRNFDMIEAFYKNYPKKLAAVRGRMNRPLTLTEKVIFTHLYNADSLNLNFPPI